MTTLTPAYTQIASGLRFPEGPVAMPDGSVVLVDIERRTLSRVTPDGKVHVVARLGGGPNGAAPGPGGKIYVTNNGGLKFVERPRSEERRVGKEWRSRWSPHHLKKQKG